ncbi:MAG: tyrosine--tRNA ligase [Anaerolineales bacterium]|nr:tyrosine--tRNA ligase [Anaerolineales bacterium]MDP7643281.1 tyrosine--tRNA ligase [Anaerolineales bacterium]HJL69532.1 tyrosine--tRNA ligase [Anaerolineales bacterium]HJN42339.1 tyrosine--tRNA ligase [Anaerolineales bacterium]
MKIDRQLGLLMQGTEYGDDNLERSMRSELRALLLEKRPLRVYCGYDPTSADLHLGHTISMRKLRQFQDLGHEVTFLVGNYTALVGDPSDKNKARPLLNEQQVSENAETYAAQAFRILDSEKTRVRYNGEWLAGLTLVELIGLAQKFTVQQFMARDNFSRRLERSEPIYLHETLYALMQGYDAAAMEADVQVGGTDQLFNIVVAGRKLQQSLGQKPQVGVVLGILPGTDGKSRMSKTTGNHIPIATTAEDMYGKVMSIPDVAMSSYWRLTTRYTPEQVREVERRLESAELHPRDAKSELAGEITAIFWGTESARKAAGAFRKVFQLGVTPDDLRQVVVKKGELLVDVILECNFAGSRGEARRLIRQGGVRVDGEYILDERETFAWESEVVLQVGKRRFARLLVNG